MIVEHIEKFVGHISYGTIRNEFDKVNIAIINDKPICGLKTFVTLGLHYHDMNYKSRFELVFVCNHQIQDTEITSFLLWFANLMIEEQRPLLRGQVIFLPRQIGESLMNALYVATPFYFDKEFQVIKNKGDNVIFPLLVPIYESEAKLIQGKGWKKFENFLYQEQIDNLCDLSRQSFKW